MDALMCKDHLNVATGKGGVNFNYLYTVVHLNLSFYTTD